MLKLIAMILLTMTTLVACEQSTPKQSAADPSSSSDWVRVDLDSLSTQQVAERDRAIAARDLLASTLKGELMAAIQTGGPVHAIQVCNTRAPEIAADVARDQDVQIGRDAQRRRNPDNTGPDWAELYQSSEISSEIACENGEGGMGFAFPIMLEGACVLCHGTEEQIPDAVQTAISDLYPDDHATGFAPGDHRGWFWVQVDH